MNPYVKKERLLNEIAELVLSKLQKEYRLVENLENFNAVRYMVDMWGEDVVDEIQRQVEDVEDESEGLNRWDYLTSASSPEEVHSILDDMNITY